MDRFVVRILFIVSILYFIDNACYAQSDSLKMFCNFQRIRWIDIPKYIAYFQPDSFSIDWGNKTLVQLEVNGLSNYAKALKIQKYVHENFGCTGRQYSIPNMIKNKNGNCADHAVISIFLLRMAGVPSKFAFEINLKNNFYWWGNKAKKQHCGLYGFNHNDHVWVLFYDGTSWQPYDSELNIFGIDDFVKTRWGKRSPYFLGITPYGPPFIIWEDTGNGLLQMKTITKQIWNHKPDETYNRISKNEWYKFIDIFEGATYEALEHTLFSSDKERAIKAISHQWF